MPSPASSDRATVLVVDDSAAERMLISEILGSDPELKVVGSAVDGQDAVEMVERLRPSVVTMDLVMPTVDGLEAIRRIMASRPTPIAVVAAPQASETWVFEAMEAGAVTVIQKPVAPTRANFQLQAERLISAVKLTASASVTARPNIRRAQGRDGAGSAPTRLCGGRAEVIAIAASTGGPQVLARIARELPGNLRAPILLVQHIAPGFEAGLAQWLDTIGPLRVRVARRGAQLRAGEIAVAPAGLHLGVDDQRRATLSASAPIGGFRPSATYLFRSVAVAYGRRALGVVLSGMGDDGAAGLLDLKRAGGSVIVQDEASSVVYGMPRAARSVAADQILAPAHMGAAIEQACGVV